MSSSSSSVSGWHQSRETLYLLLFQPHPSLFPFPSSALPPDINVCSLYAKKRIPKIKREKALFPSDKELEFFFLGDTLRWQCHEEACSARPNEKYMNPPKKLI